MKAMSAVKSDKDTEERCKQYLSKVRGEITEEIDNVKSTLDTKFSTEVSKLREEIAGLRTEMTGNSDKQLRIDLDALR